MSFDDTGFLFSTPKMTEIFSLSSQLRAMMRFEWALSLALEQSRIAAPGSGSALERFLDAAFVDRESLRASAVDAGNIAIPFVHQLTAEVKTQNEAAARTVHLAPPARMCSILRLCSRCVRPCP